MKIIIVGAGEVGYHIASHLALENKEVEEAVESLASIIHGHKNNNRAAGIIFKTKLMKLMKLLILQNCKN